MKKRITLFLLPLLILMGCAKAPITGRTQIMMVSPQQEQAMGFQTEEAILKKEKLSTDKALVERVTRVGMRIAKATGLKKDWKFFVIDKPKTANAFCLANGHVFVYSGIMKYVGNDAQLATVMGHEMGHAIAHHVAEQVSMAMMTNLAATAAAAAIDSKVHNDAERAAYIAALGLGANVGVVLPYSRMLENEADHIGLMLMAKACYDPRQAIAFWKKFAKQGKEPPVYFSTHPSSEERIRHLEELMPQALKIYRESGCRKEASKRTAEASAVSAKSPSGKKVLGTPVD
ncbi:M48 family metallopeptidase [Hydrogenimonas sp. SS33]|uniref:M48 family metallopeptidase n=1 Tax=Hydrogenimonas leucolamina TaxID=2954236 RepID=UPI00336C0569